MPTCAAFILAFTVNLKLRCCLVAMLAIVSAVQQQGSFKFIVNAKMYGAPIQSMQSTKLCLSGEKSMTVNSYTTWVVHRLDLRPLRSCMHSQSSLHTLWQSSALRGLSSISGCLRSIQVPGAGSADGGNGWATHRQPNDTGSYRSGATTDNMFSSRDRLGQETYTSRVARRHQSWGQKSPNAAGPTQRPLGQPKRGEM